MANFVNLTMISPDGANSAPWPVWVNLDHVAYAFSMGDPPFTQLQLTHIGGVVEIEQGDRRYTSAFLNVRENADQIMEFPRS
jgi:hypothetical protein